MSRSAVLVVEDDPLQGRLISGALEPLGVHLVWCTMVDDALEALAQQSFDLVITDLHLHDRSGYEVVERVAAARAVGGAPKVLVFSGDLSENHRQRLASAGVWHMLAKPISIPELQMCVSSAVGRDLGISTRRMPLDAPEDGDANLRADFMAQCIPQFRLDVLRGDVALIANDLESLRRLAHDLKTVLSVIGLDTAAQYAAQLEQDALAGPAFPAQASWEVLRLCLVQLCETPA
jgi:CheY-like chemotaxis protein